MVGRSSSTTASFSIIDASVTISRVPHPSELLEVEHPRLVARLERRVALVELRLHAPHDVGGVAVGGQIVGGREEEPLGALPGQVQLVEERGAACGVEPAAHRADVHRLEPPRDVEDGPALGDGDPDVAGGRGALEPRHDLLRRQVVGEQVDAGHDASCPARPPQVQAEEAGRVGEPRRREPRHEHVGRLPSRHVELHVAPGSGAVRGRERQQDEPRRHERGEHQDRQRPFSHPPGRRSHGARRRLLPGWPRGPLLARLLRHPFTLACRRPAGARRATTRGSPPRRPRRCAPWPSCG